MTENVAALAFAPSGLVLKSQALRVWKVFDTRKNWMFWWTELGAELVGLIQSLLATCRLQDINHYTYLVDVLQRVSIHRASRVAELTPRLWKVHFADNPLRSDIFDTA